MFCRAGVLGTKRVTEKDEKRGFSEADQENLYNTAHVRSPGCSVTSGGTGVPGWGLAVHFRDEHTDWTDSGCGGGCDLRSAMLLSAVAAAMVVVVMALLMMRMMVMMMWMMITTVMIEVD